MVDESVPADDIQLHTINDLCEKQNWGKVRDCLDSPDVKNKLEMIQWKDKYGDNSLHWACRCLNPNPPLNVVELLLQYGGGKNLVLMKNDSDQTPLHKACFNGRAPRFDVMESLVKEGGEELIMMQDKYGSTALHTWCDNARHIPVTSFDKTMKLLVNAGGKESIMMPNKMGFTALHSLFGTPIMGYFVRIEVLELLVKEGGEELIMMQDVVGNTVLHTLCIHLDKHDDAYQKIRMFLNNCSDKDKIRQVKDAAGQTALDLADRSQACKPQVKNLLTPGHNFAIALEQQHTTVGFDDNPKNTNDYLGNNHHADALVEVVESMMKPPDAGNVTIGL